MSGGKFIMSVGKVIITVRRLRFTFEISTFTTVSPLTFKFCALTVRLFRAYPSNSPLLRLGYFGLTLPILHFSG